MPSAYMLHSRSYTDSRRLVDLFCLSCGHIRAVMRVNRGKHYKAPQLFTPLDVIWRGKGELKTITSIEDSQPHLNLSGIALSCGLYLNELLVRALHSEDDCSQLYRQYETTLRFLSKNEKPEPHLRRFELVLLESLGYGIEFDCDVNGNKIVPDNEHWYRYDVGVGFIPFSALNTLDLLVSGQQLYALAQREFEKKETLTVAKKVCRIALRNVIGDKPIKSRELFK